ncbi:hypothetical protein KC939_02220 [Candidatus Saccharibacteria bacterium]|nr:hypothetical protein [Candidatus Saccharibacteria bacterium]
MSEDQFTKLFKHMNQRFDAVESRLEKTASQDSLDRLTSTIDAFMKRLDAQETELAAHKSQMDKLLVWARKVSEKTGIPLENL